MYCLGAIHMCVQMFDRPGNKWPHNAWQYHQLMPISCNFSDCKYPAVTGRRQVSPKQLLETPNCVDTQQTLPKL